MEQQKALLYNTVIILYVIGTYTTPCGAQTCSEPMDLTIIFDWSGDVTIIHHIRQFLIKFVEAELQLSFSNDLVNFIQYGSWSISSGNHVTSSRRARTALEDMRSLSGGRDRMTSKALDFYLSQPASNDRSDVPNVVLLVITGPSEDKTRAIESAERIRSAGHDLMVISVTPCTDLDEIVQLASPPRVEGQNYFLFDDYTDLDAFDTTAEVADGLCNRDVPAVANDTVSTISTSAPRICIEPTTEADPTSTSTSDTNEVTERPVFRSSTESAPESGGLTTSQKAVLGVFIPLILLTIAGAGIFYYCRKKK